MIEEEVIGSHTEDDHTDVKQDDTDISRDEVFAMFGIEKPQDKQEEKAAETDPAKDQKPEPKTIKVKVDKEEREFDVSEDKLPEYVQKAYALDKERERKVTLEKNLERAAKLAGFEKVDDYLTNLDKLEQDVVKKQADHFDTLKQQIVDDLIYNGVDEQTAKEYAENNPLVVEARSALQEKQQAEQSRQQQTAWKQLYDAFPDIVDSAKLFTEGKEPDWYNDEMKSMIQSGYKPLHAYKLAHMDKIQTQTKKATEQRLIKEQQLGLRSRVETVTTPDNEPAVPDALAAAFRAFDLPVSAAKKYVK